MRPPWLAALSFRLQVAAELSANRVAITTSRADKSTREGTRDAAPTEAGAVPGTSSPSDHACIYSTCWPRSSLDRNFPSGMGDRRVGTWMPCEVHRFVAQDYV